MEFLREPKQLIITKANVRSRVHRRVHMDYIGVKRFDDDGELIGEFRIVGLFTSTAYTRSTRSIPYLRRKVDNLMRRSGFDPDSHSGKAFAAVLENYSRDELFQIDEDTLYHFVLAIMHLDERPRVRVLARRDRFDRFVSIMVFVPRERYDSNPRRDRPPIWRASTRAASRRSIPSSPKGRWCACISSSRALTDETPNPDRATLERAVEATGAHLDRRARRSADAGARADQVAAAHPALSRGVPGRLPRGLCAAGRGRRHPPDRKPVADPPARRGLLQPPRGRRGRRGPEGVEPREADPAFRARARAGEHGLQGRGRAHLPDRAGRAGCDRGSVDARHDARTRRRRGVRSRSAEGAARSLLHGGDARARRERRLQRAGAERGRAMARRRAGAHHLALSAPGARRLFAGLHVEHAAPASRDRRADRRAVPHALRSAHRAFDRAARREAERVPGRDRDRARGRSKASTRTASCATSSTP